MSYLPLTVNEALRPWSRVELGSNNRLGSALRDALLLAVAGAAAACAVHWLGFSVKIPGHAIVRSVLPLALGMALAPRRFSGTLAGVSALLTTGLLRATGSEGVGVGALTSLLLAGPAFDAALWQPRSGPAIYLRCAAAGLAINLAAFTVRGTAKLGTSPLAFSQWWSAAALSHALCGAVAGLLCAVLFFRWSPRGESRP